MCIRDSSIFRELFLLRLQPAFVKCVCTFNVDTTAQSVQMNHLVEGVTCSFDSHLYFDPSDVIETVGIVQNKMEQLILHTHASARERVRER